MPLESQEIGARLRARRKTLGISQTALAELSGTHQRMVSRWELGKGVPSALQLVALCDALYVKPADILAPSVAA